ncbi:hypothetical protein FRC11_006601 [Ceratobasidium sp. 423]|nr:hypothetical protein FRC11_006601 [Ceratobasidium sp. 423]
MYIRYRDLSDLLKRGNEPTKPVDSNNPKEGADDHKTTKSATPAGADPTVTELCDEEDRWEEEWELDDVIEKDIPGSQYVFEVEESDGVDLNDIT